MAIGRCTKLWAASALALMASVIYGQDYPTKPIRMVVPVPSGGSTDTVGRILGPQLTERSGQAAVIDNRAGAAGNLATEIVVRSPPDGYTLLLSFSTALTVNPALYTLTFNVEKDLAPVIHLANAQYVLVVHPSVPAKSVMELVAIAKQRPHQLNFGSGGTGSALHLAAELFKQRTGIDIVHVAYKGGGPAALAVLSGEVQILFGGFAANIPYVKSARLRALAVTGGKRSALMSDLPTIAESGFPGYDFSGWNAIFVPSKTPKSIISRLNLELTQILAQPNVRDAFLRIGVEPSGSTPEQLGAVVRNETVIWKKVVTQAHIQPE